jgi:inhibitor of the pro-sigma K processing machinery
MSISLSPTAEQLIPLCLVGLVILLLLGKPVATLLKLLARSALGAGVLAVLSTAAPFLGLGVNGWNACVLGLLGAPGLGLLLMMKVLVS